ncbi:MAG: molybdopterin molybdotransferase MoeA [Rhizobiaceae bacterium]
MIRLTIIRLMSMPDNPSRAMDDCFAFEGKRLLHHEAMGILKERLPCISTIETIPLENAGGRILAQSVTATANVPSYDNSAVDGYAFNFADYEKLQGRFAVSDRIAAGSTDVSPLSPDSAVRIFTGAAIPAGADTVAMQEDCSPAIEVTNGKEQETVTIPAGLKSGANLRRAGEDLKKGEEMMGSGQILRPQELAAIASIGLPRIEVFSKLRIALISSGDEIKRPGTKLESGQVYDSNHYLLLGLLDSLNIEVTDLNVLPDDANIVENTLSQAAQTHDVILTTGGASLGEEDHIIDTLDRLGSRHLWQLAIKPGRPMSFGQIGNSFVFGLPGNPVAAFVCFLLYVRPSLLRLGGGQWIEPQRYMVPAGFDVPAKKPDRREFWRAWLENGEDGSVLVKKFSRDGSGLVSGLREATGLLEISEDVTSVKQGDLLAFIPFTEFGMK